MSVSTEKLQQTLREFRFEGLGHDLFSTCILRHVFFNDKNEIVLECAYPTLLPSLWDSFQNELSDFLKSKGYSQALLFQEVKTSPTPLRSKGINNPQIKRIIAVSSGKGGVGKSTVTSQLALSLRSFGLKIGVLDADLYGPNMPRLFGLSQKPQSLEKDGKSWILPVEAFGLKVLSLGSLMEPNQAVIWRGPMLHKTLEQFAKNVEWGDLDYLLIDCPPGTGDIQLSLAELFPLSAVLMITTPQNIAVDDVRKSMNMWMDVQIPLLGVVQNMSLFQCDGCQQAFSIFGEGGGSFLSRKFQTELLVEIPLHKNISQSSNDGIPLGVSDPESELTQCFLNLALKIEKKCTALASEAVDPSALLQIERF